MIEEHDLGVLFTLDVDALAHSIHVGRVLVGIHIDHLSVTAVSEEKTGIRVGVDFEIRGVSVLDLLAFPRVVAQIVNIWLDLLLLREDEAEVFLFHAVGQVDIRADLTLVALISNEQNCGQSAISETLFTLGKLLKEGVSGVGVARASKRLNLSLLLVLTGFDSSFLAFFKLLASQKFSLAVAADFIELTHEVCVFKIEEIFVSALGVEVFLIVLIVVEIRVEEVRFVIFSHSFERMNLI